MMEKAASLRPDILSHFMLPRVLDVAATRSWDAWIHAAWRVPVGIARKIVPTITAVQLALAFALAGERSRTERQTNGEGNWHCARCPELSVDQVDRNADFN